MEDTETHHTVNGDHIECFDDNIFVSNRRF